MKYSYPVLIQTLAIQSIDKETTDPQSFSKNGNSQGETANNYGLTKAQQINSESSFSSEALTTAPEQGWEIERKK